MPEGFKTASYGWVNNHGYEYQIVEIDDGCFEIRYRDSPQDNFKIVFEFNDLDAEGIINAMQSALTFSRSQQRKER